MSCARPSATGRFAPVRAPRFRCAAVLVLSVLLVLAGAAPALCASARHFVLTVLHTNDIHAHVAESDRMGQTCTEAESATGQCLGGYPRIAAEAAKVRAQGGHVLLLDAGDQFQGTMFYTELKGRPMRDCVNAMAYTAMTLGNHEFDDGPGVLAETFLEGLHVPVLAANMDASREPLLQGRFKPSTVVTVGGRKIGLVGLTHEHTNRISSPGPNLVFSDAEKALRDQVKELRAHGVKTVIAITHVGYQRDMELASKVDGVDLIVGGHSHTLLSDTDPNAAGPYPTVVKSPSGKPVLVVQAKCWGQYLGRLDLTLDDAGAVVAHTGAPLLMDASKPQDKALLERVRAWQKDIAPMANRPLGSVTEDVSGACRFGECALGDLLADALRMAAKNQGVQAAFVNGGALRSGLRAGPVTLGDLLTVYPFQDTVATFDLSGADLLAVLEHSVSRADTPDGQGTGRFLQVSGLRFSFDPGKPVGHRLASVAILGTDGEYAPVDPAKTYTLASTGYLMKGGDGYTVLKDKAKRVYAFGIPVADALTDYFTTHSPFTPRPEGRIVRLGDALGK